MGDKDKKNHNFPSPLGQYFTQDNGTNNIFDQLTENSAMMTSVVESASTQDLFRTACEYISGSSSPHLGQVTPVCNIFASEQPSEMTASSFFDSIGPPTNSSKLQQQHQQNQPRSQTKHEGPFPSPLIGFEEVGDEVHGSECERSREAWIPNEATRRALIAAATNSSHQLQGVELTSPGIVLEEDMADNVQQLVRHHFGETEASHRKVLSADHVSQDERGLVELIRAECLRAAVNLSGRLVALYGQGANKKGQPTKHTPHSVQLWFTRLALLVKLGAYQIAEAEGAAWWNPDRPDLYYQYYPDVYGGRPGTMLPFQMRLLLATLPAYVKKFAAALERLYSVLAVVKKIIANLESGKGEDGSLLELAPKDREMSKKVWVSRRARLNQSIVNVALMSKDYSLAIETLSQLIESNESVNQKRALESALGRVFLQIGDVSQAEACFENCRRLKRCLPPPPGTLSANKPDLRELVDRGLASIAHNSFQEAYDYFQKASLVDPTDIMVLNNMAVCLLYMGQLKDALTLLTTVLHTNPAEALSEALLLNVCTLFELESSRCDQNKQALLRQVAKYKGDAINVACLKLHS